MTTPTIDFVMPYGVTVEGDGSWYPKIVGDHPKKVTSAGVSLPAGPCRVAFSWDGEQSAELVLVNGDNVKRPARLEAKRGGGSTFCDGHHRGQERGPGGNQREMRARRNWHYRGVPDQLRRIADHKAVV